MPEQALPPPDQPISLEVDSKTILIDNSWIGSNRRLNLKLVSSSTDLMVLRMSRWTLFFEICLLIFFWLFLILISSIVIVSPPGTSQTWDEADQMRGFLAFAGGGLFALVATVFAIWSYMKHQIYFDRHNGLIRLGPFSTSTRFPITNSIAIQHLKKDHWRGGQIGQVNLVLMTDKPTALRIPLMSGLKPINQIAKSLADFLDVSLIDQRVPHRPNLKAKF
jgi:hypothetical protein